MSRSPAAQVSTGRTEPGVGIAVSPHFLASEAGTSILNSGGNAVDAAIAVNAVLSVVLPDTCGPGGDLFALIHKPGEPTPIALNASGRGGSGITADELRDRGLGEIPYRSPWSISVPGCVDGWIALNRQYGEMGLAALLAPAIDLAIGGFPVSEELAASLGRIHGMLSGQASAHELYPAGEPPEPGTVVRRPRFAETLRAIATDGRAAFYTGPVAEGVSEASNSLITPDDLARNQADWIDPLATSVFGRTGWTIPPNSQGYLTLASLRIFEMLNPPEDPNDPLFTHLLIEAYRSVAWEREDTVGDPSTATIGPDELLDADRLAEKAGQIRRDTTTRWPTPRRAPAGTAFMTVLDGSGIGISLIQSNYAGIGSGLSAGDTGVWLHNRGAGFNLIPGHSNEFAAGKRPLHTLSPMLWTDGPDLDMLLGTRGGDQQPQFLASFAAARYHAVMCTDDAQALPRWNMQQPEPGTDSAVRLENRFAPSVVDGLRSRGHDITLEGTHEQGWGPISAIDVNDERKGSADPRVSSSAALTT